MAVNISSNTTVYSDIDPNMTPSPKTGDLLSVKDGKAVRQSVVNLLSTNYGDRLFQPRLGSAIQAILFEPVDTISAMELRDRVLKVLTESEPRITNIIVDVVSAPDSNEYVVTVEYSIRPLGQTDRVNVVLQRIR